MSSVLIYFVVQNSDYNKLIKIENELIAVYSRTLYFLAGDFQTITVLSMTFLVFSDDVRTDMDW